MNKQEKIEQFRQQIAQLTKELSEFEKSETEITPEIGKWYLTDYEGWIIRVASIDAESVYGDYIDEDGNYHTYTKQRGVCDIFELQRPLTPSEIETALRTEWERRCKEAGWDNGVEAEIVAHADERLPNNGVNTHNYDALYIVVQDALWSRMGMVYRKGKFATPKKKDKPIKFFDWDVKYDNQLVIIGCKTFTIADIQHLQSSLSQVEGKTVNEVLLELKKLDL